VAGAPASRTVPDSADNGAVERRGRAARVRVAAWLVVAGVALAGCAGSGYQYVKSSSNNAYFKVPKDWKVYDKEQILGASEETLSQTEAANLRFVAIFDGHPQPSLEHELTTATHPFGLVRVRELTLNERDTFSLSDLRNEVVRIDDILENDLGEVELVEQPRSIVKEKGLAGARLVYRVKGPDGSFTVDQTGLVDPGTHVVYFFIIGCESKCFSENRRLISEVADSWTIKER
jgi:hypothetical protein